MEYRFFKQQKARSVHATARKKALRPKYMPSWTRHDIWTAEVLAETQKKKTPTTQTQQKEDKKQVEQKQEQTTQQTSQQPQQKEEKKSKFKFW